MVITGGTRRMSVLAAITQAADIADTVTSLKKKTRQPVFITARKIDCSAYGNCGEGRISSRKQAPGDFDGHTSFRMKILID